MLFVRELSINEKQNKFELISLFWLFDRLNGMALWENRTELSGGYEPNNKFKFYRTVD